MNLRILYQDPHLVVIEKPAGFHVHPPEDTTHRIHRSFNCLYLLNKQLGAYLYPVHRLDRATSGVLIFALTSQTATQLNQLFQSREIQKTYYAVVRGWMNPEQGWINSPLYSKEGAEEKGKASLTHYQQVATLEIPTPDTFDNPQHPTCRYSLVRIEPKTGRMHQIRRHFSSESHPLIGDTVYGDGKHNRVFRNQLKTQTLFLKAYSLGFVHPVTQEPVHFKSSWNHDWHQVFDWFGVCPYSGP